MIGERLDVLPDVLPQRPALNDLRNALTQIHFHFFYARLTQRVFSVRPVAQPVVGEMEIHSVANLATLQTPLATFFPSKNHPNLVSENYRYCRASARSCSPSARTHTPLSLSLSLSLSLRLYLMRILFYCLYLMRI